LEKREEKRGELKGRSKLILVRASARVCCREDVKNAIVGDSALNAKATLMSFIVIPFDVQYLKMPMISRFEGCSKRSGKKAPWITIKVSWKEKNTDAFRRHDIFIICPYCWQLPNS
jgi:hypothetical protein